MTTSGLPSSHFPQLTQHKHRQMARTMIKRKAFQLFEQQQEASKRHCSNNGIRYGDCEALFGPSPFPGSETRGYGATPGDQSNTNSGSDTHVGDRDASENSSTEVNSPAWCHLTGISSEHPSLDLGSRSDHSFRPYFAASPISAISSHRMITRTTKRSNTYSKVLNTGELLEKIILELPPWAIVRLRRINKTWNHVIMTLPYIRRKIFLDAEPLTGLWVYDNRHSILQPFTREMDHNLDVGWGTHQSCSRPVEYNPMLFRREDGAEQVSLHDRAVLCESLRFVARPDLHLDLSGAGSSIYHQMFVTQPPTKTVEYMLCFQDRNLNLKRQGLRSPLMSCRIRIERKNGVRLYDILDTFKRGYDTRNPTTGEVEHVDPTMNSVTGEPKDLTLRVSGHTKMKCAIWMLGAMFVSDEEETAIESLRPQPEEVQFSWQAQEQMKANNGKVLDFRPTSENFVDKPHRVRGEVVDLTSEADDDGGYGLTDHKVTDDESTDDESDV